MTNFSINIELIFVCEKCGSEVLVKQPEANELKVIVEPCKVCRDENEEKSENARD